MTLPEALETTRIHRVAGLTGARTALVTTRPCRTLHHPISDVGLIGGGQVLVPGDVSRAHHGVLLLDELPECTRHALEVLRQPLEDGVLYLQSPARPKSPYFSGLSSTDDGGEGCGQNPLATHHHDGHHTRCVTASLIRSGLCARVVLFA
jgi:predicted ATPase with chaperone activity